MKVGVRDVLFISFIIFIYTQYSIIENITKSKDKEEDFDLGEVDKLKWDKKSVLYNSQYSYMLSKIDYGVNPFLMYVRKSNDTISKYIVKHGSWSDCNYIYCLFDTLVRNTNLTGYYLDIGANIGACTLLELSHNISTIAFEPVPDNLFLLTKSLLMNSVFLDKIILYPIGLGNKRRKMNIYSDPNNWGSSTIYKKINSNIKYTYTSVIVKLDDILLNMEINHIILAKIDVEGYELSVLKGALEIMKKKKILCFVIEINCEILTLTNQNENDIYEILENNDYRILVKVHCNLDNLNTLNVVAVLNKYVKYIPMYNYTNNN